MPPCAHCGAATQSPCPARCGLVYFCGKPCKLQAWPSHAPACAATRPPRLPAGLSAEEPPSLGGVFVCREYATRTFSFPRPPPLQALEVPLDCLSAASTDFDLTGQIVWPVSRLVAQYLASGPGVAASLRGARVLELGAGCGLCGVAAAFLGAAEVVLTDNEPEVLAVLAKNAERPVPGGCALRVREFNWGDGAAAAELGTFPFLLGADVIYWSHCVEALFASAAALLAPGGVFILGFTNRRNGLREAAEVAARTAGFSWEVVDLCGWLAVEEPVFAGQLPVVTLFRMRKIADLTVF